MLNVNDKVYIHLKELEVSIDKMGFNIDRLCVIKEISTAKDTSGRDIGIYVLKCVDSDKEYRIMSDDRVWKITEASKLVEIIKNSNRYDVETKEQIIEKIYGIQ